MSWALLGVQVTALQRISEKRDARWFARLLVLCVFVVQEWQCRLPMLSAPGTRGGSVDSCVRTGGNLLYASRWSPLQVSSRWFLSFCSWTWQLKSPSLYTPRVQRASQAEEETVLEQLAGNIHCGTGPPPGEDVLSLRWESHKRSCMGAAVFPLWLFLYSKTRYHDQGRLLYAWRYDE